MHTIQRLIWYPIAELIELKPVTLDDIVYDECITRTKHDIDLARIYLSRTKQELAEQPQMAARELALAKSALKVKEKELGTMKNNSLFSYFKPQPAKDELEGNIKEVASELDDLKTKVEVAQRHYHRVKSNLRWNELEAQYILEPLIRQLHRLVKERDEQDKANESAAENTDVGQGTCVGITRQNPNDDCSQSIKSTRHDLDIARINLFLLKQQSQERMAPLYEKVSDLTAVLETLELCPARRKACMEAIRERELSIAMLETMIKLDVVEARRCVEVLLRQLGELERGERPTIEIPE